MRGSTLLAVFLVAVWVLAWGRPTPVELVLGIASALLVARFLRNLYDFEVPAKSVVRKAPAFFAFGARFVADLVLSSVDVAYRVLVPSRVFPAVVEVPLAARSDYAVTLIANRITLTPGTLSADYDADRGVLQVHSITAAKDPDAVRRQVRDLDASVRRLFGEVGPAEAARGEGPAGEGAAGEEPAQATAGTEARVGTEGPVGPRPKPPEVAP